MKKQQASITIVPSSQEWDSIRVGGCSHGSVVTTVPDTRPGAPRGATRSETASCTCGGAR